MATHRLFVDRTNPLPRVRKIAFADVWDAKGFHDFKAMRSQLVFSGLILSHR